MEYLECYIKQFVVEGTSTISGFEKQKSYLIEHWLYWLLRKEAILFIYLFIQNKNF